MKNPKTGSSKIWFVKYIGVLAIVLSLCSIVYAAKVQKIGYIIIKTADLQQMLNSTKSGKFLVIDARNPDEYKDVHIPGAINIPVSKFEKYAKLLPEDRMKTLIFYCNGVKCGKSKRAAKKAIAFGYRNVLVYEEGMPVWEEKGLPIITGPGYEAKIETDKISPQELRALIDSKKDNFTIVDVRDQSEFVEGHIPGAINIPVASFSSRSGTLDKHKTIIVYCNAGSRSYKAYRKLMKLGYKKYYQALFADWKAAGYKVEK
jgi:rhodanese-related sulfurtransferase